MYVTASPESETLSHTPRALHPRRVLLWLVALWAVIYLASCFTPAILDDADGTHANAARQMLLSHDWVTLRVNNVRYLEKAPLPYWIVAVCFRLFGFNAFAAHFPQALAVLGLTLLGFRWAREAYGDRAAFYTGLFTLTSAGVFLFTRVLIPDVLLALLLASALYTFLKSLQSSRTPPHKPVILSEGHSPKSKDPERFHAPTVARAVPGPHSPGPPFMAQPHRAVGGVDELRSVSETLYPYALWTVLALAVLTKGLVALVFIFGAAIPYLALTGEYRQWRRLRPFTGTLLFLAIAAPWHILAGLRNTQGMDGHGFFWFYFINEHVLRFLGRRIPRDYNKLPGYLYWTLHLVWLFPWSLFAALSFTSLNRLRKSRRHRQTNCHPERSEGPAFFRSVISFLRSLQPTTLLLTIYSTLVLIFFSLSTNQEYYTLPAYLPLLILLAAALAHTEQSSESTNSAQKSTLLSTPYSLFPLTFAHAALTFLGLLISAALAYGLWISRGIPAPPDIGALLAHRGVGDYTLSMSSLFDLTGPSFAALRLPAALALAAFAVGPTIAWLLRTRRENLAATTAIALTSATFLVAAHIALARFAPMLSSKDMAHTILRLEHTGQIAPNTDVLLFGDQAYGSSIGFYLNRPLSQPIRLVDGRSSSMLFGSYFPDAETQHLFLTPEELVAQWGTGPRKILFIPIERRPDAERLLAPYHPILLQETSGKLLLTDRPLGVQPASPLDR